MLHNARMAATKMLPKHFDLWQDSRFKTARRNTDWHFLVHLQLNLMVKTQQSKSRALRHLLLWVASLSIALAGLALLERQNLVRELTAQSATLHRLASQRADQHDAHLTSLSGIFVAGGTERQDLLLDVAATIVRFYPRIRSVHVIPLDPARPGIETAPSLTPESAELVRDMARRSTGALEVQTVPDQPDHYLVVKRSPNTNDAQHALAIVVDAAALVASDSDFWDRTSVFQRLTTPTGDVLVGGFDGNEPGYSKPLGSASQPLLLETAFRIDLADVLPISKVLVLSIVVTGVFGLVLMITAQNRRTREAEGRATLSAQETRLAHASRVNAMGEMASGMAHELAQPLTAILSQAQAGRHLAKRGDVERLSTVLDDTVSQAQRAADILDRLRRWSKPNRAPSKASSLNKTAQSVAQLLALEAKSLGATLTLELPDEPVFIDADPVELEQVVFNLVRNALDASDQAQVTIKVREDDGTAILEVSDSGPGIPADLKPRIFEPFVTGKPNGTGLGLALCQRLVEEMDGDIALLPDKPETTFRLSFAQVIAQGDT